MKYMILILLACLRTSVGVAKPGPVEKVCQAIQACDEAVCQELQKQGPLNETIVFSKMRSYIDAVYELVKCLHKDKEGTVKVPIAKEIIDKKGAKFIIDVPWTYRIGRQDYGWDGSIIQDFLNWRMLTQEVWMDVEKYFDPTAYIPEELYTESYEK